MYVRKRIYYPIMAIFYVVFATVIVLVGPVAMYFVFPGLFVFQMLWSAHHQSTLEKTFRKKVHALEDRLKNSVRYQDATRSRFTSLTEVMDIGLLSIDEHGMIREANGYFRETFDLPAAVDEHYDVLKPHKTLHSVVQKAHLSEKAIRDQIVHNDRHFDLNLVPVYEEDQYKGCMCLVHDITQIKTAETYQKQFTADVTHELRTPLSALRGISEVVLRDADMEKEKRREFDRLIHAESVRLEKVLNDLLIISQMDRHDYELNIKQVDIGGLISESIKLFEPAAQEKGLEIRHEIEKDEIDIDLVKMQSVIINLIENAINYTDHGHIELTGKVVGEHYIMEIADTGIGIAHEEHEKVFKRFQRVDQARSRSSGGSGLGLSIVKNVVHKHRGMISLDSTPGEGSTFKITLLRRMEKPLQSRR